MRTVSPVAGILLFFKRNEKIKLLPIKCHWSSRKQFKIMYKFYKTSKTFSNWKIYKALFLYEYFNNNIVLLFYWNHNIITVLIISNYVVEFEIFATPCIKFQILQI